MRPPPKVLQRPGRGVFQAHPQELPRHTWATTDVETLRAKPGPTCIDDQAS